MNIIKKIYLFKRFIARNHHCPNCNVKLTLSKTKILKKIHYINSCNYNLELDRPSIANRRKREDVLKNEMVKKTVYNYKCTQCNHIGLLKEI